MSQERKSFVKAFHLGGVTKSEIAQIEEDNKKVAEMLKALPSKSGMMDTVRNMSWHNKG